MVRPTYVEIDLDAIAHNVAAFAKLITPSLLCTVVKADAYGHGDVPVATTALENGASWLAVALVEEGVRLREAGIEAPILVLSEPPLSAVDEVASWSLTPTVYSSGFAEALGAGQRGLGVHVKVDTGMHRVGVQPDELGHVLGVCLRAGLEVEGLWSHFSVADTDSEFTSSQISLFDELAPMAPDAMLHLANTPGTLLFPEARFDMCRVGLGTYGLHASPATSTTITLKPAMRVVTQVSHVKRLPAGRRPSYGRKRELLRESTLATAPIGYADGFHRALTEDAVVLVGGKRHPLAGAVTMDQIIIDVGDEPVSVGDEVVLMGRQGGEEVTADDWAAAMGSINYEVICSLGPRVPRRYR